MLESDPSLRKCPDPSSTSSENPTGPGPLPQSGRTFRRRRCVSRSQKWRVLKRDDFTCRYCGRDLLRDLDSLLGATIDHLQPRVAGGGNGRDNLVACCVTCNLLKGSTFAANVAESRNIIQDRRASLTTIYAAELAMIDRGFGDRPPDDRPAGDVLAGLTVQARELARALRAIQRRLPRPRPWWARLFQVFFRKEL